MNETIATLKKVLKDLFEKNSTWFGLILIFQTLSVIFVTWLIFTAFIELTNNQYHYYANITKSLEEISGKTFDRYDGTVKKNLTTEEILIRKNYYRNKFSLKKFKFNNRY